MYDYIQGKISELTPTATVLETAGIGYYINISLNTFSFLESVQAGGESTARLYVQFIVREDAHLLYGFATRQERELFRLLTGVSGVGVATARMVLSTYSPKEVCSMIATENVTLLKNVKGLGLKTAQKIVLELRDKVLSVVGEAQGGFGIPAPQSASTSVVEQEALSALTMLGFPKAPSEKVIKSIVSANPDAEVEEVIRMALKKL